ncbi:phenoloxidase-activating factor 2-like [Zerene cesonia]|uniref:phenoloxidase-activating factor 2-like n=1 Tax=Zerene cesonia TaxID=33412 RepID=UPI0018E4F1B7|nr:phenoloxidase-activating factor 2-like [Zerene cesonia]
MMWRYQATFVTILCVVSALNLDPAYTKDDNNVTNTKCVTKDNEPGVCVVYYLCNDNGTLNTDGAGIIDIRISESACPSYLDVCCRTSRVRDSDDPITPRPEIKKGCGWRNPNGVGFVSTGDPNGDYSKFGEFPWMVAVLRQEPVNENDSNSQLFDYYIGGGSLIHPSVVLTVAHIVYEAHHYRARAGEWDTQTTKEIYPFQERRVDAVLVHEEFQIRNLINDVALLMLASPMTTAPNVGFACLPPRGYVPAGGTPCLASGWGKNEFGEKGRYQVIMKKVEIPIVERNQCQERLRRTRLGKFFKLNQTFLCAGGELGKDTCKGDGGSPLVCPVQNQENRYLETGMVSWGIGCGKDGTPGVYVNVAVFRDWIDRNMVQNGYDTASYSLN